MSLTLTTAASGVARVAHYVVPTGQTQPIPTLLLEGQRTNLCIRSEELSDAAWGTGGVTVTANSTVAPDGTSTADTLTSAGSGPFENVAQDITFTGNGEKCVAVYLKAGTATTSAINMFDNTATVSRHLVNVAWTAGVPTLSTASGSGTLYPVESLANGWYRLLFSATGIVAANVNRVVIYPTGTGTAAGTVFAWGAQVENAVVPSSYIKTEGTVVTRNADSLYFPFTALPQAMTVYVRGVERGVVNTGSVDYVFGIGLNSGARIQMRKASSVVDTLYHNGATSVNSGSVSSTATLNALREFRATVTAAGVLQSFVSNNNAAEASSTASSALALTGSFSAQRIYLNSAESANTGMFAFTNVVVAAGEQSRDTMRQLAGVV